MPVFGLVTEGITDQIVIEDILYGYFNSSDVDIIELQPLRDATDEDKASNDGNWHKVFEYCKSSIFRGAFQQEDNYVIIQVDSDVFLGDSISQEYKIATRNDEGEALEKEEILENIVEKLIEVIGVGFYQLKKDKIIFAISIHSLECWLLPLYFKDSKKEKIVQCLKTLNRELNKKYGFTIDSKQPKYYRKVSKPWRKHKIFKQKYKENYSLNVFVENLASRKIELSIEEDW